MSHVRPWNRRQAGAVDVHAWDDFARVVEAAARDGRRLGLDEARPG